MLLLEETAREIGLDRTGERTDLRQNSVEGDYRWDSEVAEKIGVSRDTVRKGTDVYRFAYPDQFVHST
jgi:hypothetical protein